MLKRKKFIFPMIAAIIILAIVICLIVNQMGSRYENLSPEDQKILAEYDSLYKSMTQKSLWDGFNLHEHPIVLISKDSVNAYMINADHVSNGIFAREIEMPKDFSLKSVYRLSILTPQLIPLRYAGNFNTIGKQYSIFGNDVYFVKYSAKVSLEKEYSSEHFAAFLAHESLHYYMQNQWRLDSLPTSQLDSDGLQLLQGEYQILSKIQIAREQKTTHRESQLDHAKALVSAIDKRLENNAEYVTEELIRETAEGTATYVGIKAAEIVGYDFGVMYFDNVKNVSFDDVLPQIENGNLAKKFLYSRMPYETGAEICFLLDELGVPNWQEQLNNQTLKQPETLYSVLKRYVDAQS